MSGRFAAIISVGLPKRVFRFKPASPNAAPTSVWQKLSNPLDRIGLLAEYLRLEEQNARVALPRAGRQRRLHAGVLEKGFNIPPVLARHLRQQQSAPVAPLDDETVPSNFNVLNRAHLAFRAQCRNLDRQPFQILGGDRREPRIRVRHDAAEMSDDASDRPVVSEAPKAAAQLVPTMDRRLEAILQDAGNAGPDALIRRVVAAVKQHAGEAPQSDDVTVLAFKYLGV